MEITRITRTDAPLYAEAMNLYGISFPLHEQREADSQTAILQQEAYHFDVVCDKGNFVGAILYWDMGGSYYVEHFCVRPEMRNQHYGQKILEAYRNTPLLLEIDPPVDELSIRRRHFYERCGFVENPYPHVHPAYHRGNTGHALVVMSAPKALSAEEYERFYQFLQETVMKNAY